MRISLAFSRASSLMKSAIWRICERVSGGGVAGERGRAVRAREGASVATGGDRRRDWPPGAPKLAWRSTADGSILPLLSGTPPGCFAPSLRCAVCVRDAVT